MQDSFIFGTNQAGQLLENWLETQQYNQVFVLMDNNVRRYCYPLIKPFLKKHNTINVLGGEEHKNLEACNQIWQHLSNANASRKDLMINLGGGMVSDLGGFCAGTFKRGMDFVQIPTTLLAMSDASVGGKTGIDFQGFKNQIGLFAMPKMVLIDTHFLKTLPENELHSGFAEIVKHGLIADKARWDKMRKLDLDQQPLEELLRFSIETKKAIVQQDPHEQGLRKVLNFGHTVGHAIECYFLQQNRKPLLHGYAIAIGIIAESWISWEMGLLDRQELDEIEEFMFSVYGQMNLKSPDLRAIASLCQQDKKNQDEQILATLLKGIGNVVYNQAITQQQVVNSLKFYLNKLDEL